MKILVTLLVSLLTHITMYYCYYNSSGQTVKPFYKYKDVEKYSNMSKGLNILFYIVYWLSTPGLALIGLFKRT